MARTYFRQYEKVIDGRAIQFYELRFFVSNSLEYFSYYYVKFLKNKKRIILERAPGRTVVLANANNDPGLIRSKNSYTKYDEQFDSQFKIMVAPGSELVYYGYYVCQRSDFEALKKNGIRLCLCVFDETDSR